MSKKGLGKGLGALIPEIEVAEPDRKAIREVEVEKVRPNPHQPRKEFDAERMEELAASIREHGVVQPIVVRPGGDGYELVAGERRWRAARLAGLERIPALVREFSDAESMEIALVENLQREDLNPLEEAEAYKALMEKCQLTQEQLASRVGKSRSQVANTLRLLQLGPVAAGEVRAGRLSMGHAKVLLGVDDPAVQDQLALRIVAEGLSVREVEGLLRRKAAPPPKREVDRASLSPDLKAVEGRLREWFGTPVKLTMKGDRGRLEITYFGEEGLGRLLEILGLSEGPAPSSRKVPFHV